MEWGLLSVPEHAGIHQLVADLNRLYKNSAELYALDESPEGFEWINHISSQECYLAFLRKGEKKDQIYLVIANFAGVLAEITAGVPCAGKYKEIFNTDDEKYGGTGLVNRRVKCSKPLECDDRQNSITVKLAPLSLSILKYVPLSKEEIAEQRKKEKAVKKKKTTKKAEK